MAKRSGLGRGLESLMGEAMPGLGQKPAHTEGPSQELSVSVLHPNPNQPRHNFDEEAMAQLADSIRQNGVLQPILVRPVGGGHDAYEIVAGERRYQAAKRAGLEKVPVYIREINDNEVFQLALIENLQRANLDPMEEALGYQTLLEQQELSKTDLGEILSKSRSYIANTIRLLDLPEEVQQMVRDGLLTAGHARAILAVADPEARIALARKVAQENLSVRQTEQLASQTSVAKAPSERTPRQAPPQVYKRAAQQLKLALDADVKVKSVRGKNKIEIVFDDEDDLQRIMEQLLA